MAILPLYLLLRELQLIDNPLGVALPQAAFALPVTIVILRPFMRALPGELEDAAMIDGCSRLGFIWRILLPLSGPGAGHRGRAGLRRLLERLPAAAARAERPGRVHAAARGRDVLARSTRRTPPRVLAFTSLAMLPALVFFLLAERRIVGGLTGAVKG